MNDYTITTTTDEDLTDGWDIALDVQGKPGVADIEKGRGFEGDPDAWIIRADGLRLAVGVDVEDIEDEDGETIGQRVIGVTWTEWEADEDGSDHDIATDGVIVEDECDIATAVEEIAAWAANVEN